MEYEKAYVFQPENGRPVKRRRIEPQGLQASWQSRRRAYQRAWQAQQEKVDARLDKINSATVAEIEAFLSDANHDQQPSRIPSGIVISGPSAASDSGIISQLSRGQGNDNELRIFVKLASNAGSNLKALLKALIQKATLQQPGADDEDDEVAPVQRKGGKLLNYDLQLLCDHVGEQRIRQVVVAFEDTEAFDSELLSELIDLLGCWQDRIPFVCLFSVATSVELLQQRLSNAAVKRLDGKVFDVAPSGDVLEQIFEAITDSDAPLFLGSGPIGAALERQKDYIQSSDSFVDAIKYAYMSCYYANALSVFLTATITFADVPSDHFEALRTLKSFQRLAEHLLADNQAVHLHDLLEDDEVLFDLVQTKLIEGRKALGQILSALTVIRAIQESLPSTAVSTKSSLYVRGMAGKMAGSAMVRSLLLTIRKIPSDIAIGLLKAVAATGMPCTGFLNQLTTLVETHADDKRPLRSEDDLKNSTLRTTVVAQKVELSKQKAKLSQQDTAYTTILKRFADALEIFFGESLINPKDLPFHEIFIYDLVSPHREVFTPRPRHAIERALASPHDYLDCDCCAPDTRDNDEAILAATQPATAVLYQLYLESGSLINVNDLWHALQAVMGDGQDEQQTMALFQRALAELRGLGMLKSTRKRVDHIAKVAWKGL
ncbi:hypothetical protein LTR08_006578 [Meristemomyces frigidus]|nr:hypothetical protein LTR08_006578 [Meristemomyces frigidus]